MKSIKILGVVCSMIMVTNMAIAQSWNDNQYKFNRDQSNHKLLLNINNDISGDGVAQWSGTIDSWEMDMPVAFNEDVSFKNIKFKQSVYLDHPLIVNSKASIRTIWANTLSVEEVATYRTATFNFSIEKEVNNHLDNENSSFAENISTENGQMLLLRHQIYGFYDDKIVVEKELLAINSSNGHVGIGTLDPTEKLEVAGNVKATGLGIEPTTLDLDGSGYTGSKEVSARILLDGGANDYRGLGMFMNTTNNDILGWFAGTSYADNTEGFSIGFATNSTGIGYSAARKENSKFYVHKDGNVGIGTTAPTEKLDVRGHITTNGSVIAETDIIAFGSIVALGNIKTSGDLIIDYGGQISFGNDSVGETGYIMNTINEDGSGEIFIIAGSGFDNNHRIINMDGNVGVGTTEPEAKLHIGPSGTDEESLYIESDNTANTIDARIDGTVVFGGENGSVSSYTVTDENDETTTYSPITNESIGESYYSNFGVWITSGLVANDLALAGSNDWGETQPDYVFESSYVLPSLASVETFVSKNGHLEGIPSKAEVTERGWSLPEMDQKLLKKVEELTLYTIEQNKQIEAQQKQMDELQLLVKSLIKE
ncbi:MAG: hypothetical protein ABJF11_13865 [Reichenbachiella sp.]|uniref:hypothetical protein n=1 Tax=Reichenbachiella sp. TaxID=2184521 RepID=UPI0032643D84